MKHMIKAFFEYLVNKKKRCCSTDGPDKVSMSIEVDGGTEVRNFALYFTSRVSQTDHTKIVFYDILVYEEVPGKEPEWMEEPMLAFGINAHGSLIITNTLDLEDDLFEKAQVFVAQLMKHWEIVWNKPSAISVIELPPFPENCNPFHHDLVAMGSALSGGWFAMYHQHAGKDTDGVPYEEPETIVLVNSRTGRRFELDMTFANLPLEKKD